MTLHALTMLAILATAVVYGTDVFCAAVQRPALAQVDDDTLSTVMGQVHHYGDRRMPIFGVTGLVAAIASTILALVTGRGGPAGLTGAAVVALVSWLVIYAKVSAPINKQLTAAAVQHHTHPDARRLQRAWDGVIVGRAALQGFALAALCIAVAM